jgi:hypothetical protein
MLVFVVIVDDTHCDLDVQVFLNSSDAIECARGVIGEQKGNGSCDVNSSMERDGWLYYGSYGESNNVYVLQRETQI